MNNTGRICAEISLDAVDRNLKLMASKMTPGCQIIAVVKANSYGHGACAISKHIEQDPLIWGFAVATASEAMELRRSGIIKPVMLLGYVFPDSYEELIREDVRLCVFDVESAAGISKCAGALGRTARIHLALDTGMSRIGLPDREEGVAAAQEIVSMPNLSVEGLFTHFARADEKEIEPAATQLIRYLEFDASLRSRGIDIPLRHVSNSAGIMRMPEANLDLVRAGITLYGLLPSVEIADEVRGLSPVMRLVSHISYVKMLPAGAQVSYGGTFTAPREIKVATIPVGYADGYPRLLSNKGEVLIRGTRVPIIGRVCMDQFMVDVSGLDNAAVGDEVVLLGEQGGERITAEELGAISGRFNYELVSCISHRVPRRFTLNGRTVSEVDYLI